MMKKILKSIDIVGTILALYFIGCLFLGLGIGIVIKVATWLAH